MGAEIKDLYNVAMGTVMKHEAKTHGRFFTQSEFENNYGQIMIITRAKTRADEALAARQKQS